MPLSTRPTMFCWRTGGRGARTGSAIRRTGRLAGERLGSSRRIHDGRPAPRPSIWWSGSAQPNPHTSRSSSAPYNRTASMTLASVFLPFPKVRNVSTTGSNPSPSFSTRPLHNTPVAAPRSRLAPRLRITHPYPNFPILSRWGTPSFPPVLCECAEDWTGGELASTRNPPEKTPNEIG